jgi:hypothetical protein
VYYEQERKPVCLEQPVQRRVRLKKEAGTRSLSPLLPRITGK